MRNIWIFSVTILALTLALGCSGSGSSLPVTPDKPAAAISSSDSHHIWGMWQFKADPAAGTLDIVPLRTSTMHVNVVPILEPPAGAKLKISNLSFNGLICDVDVTLVHPFPGLSQYIGFDVAGIFLSKGTLSGWTDPNLTMAGSGETRLLNPDGYTRWWNPAEFSVAGQPILRYKDGLLGNKNSTAHFNCTLNGYKLFGNDLAKDADLLILSPTNRLAFIDGSSNTRHYTIDFTGGVLFNYAVDANWEPPTGTPPFTPDVYAESANRPEAWACSITEVENKLFNDGNNQGGSLKLKIDLWDHYNPGLNTLTVESPGNFDAVTITTSNIGDGVATYDVDIPSATPKAGSIDLLISAESEVTGYWDVLPNNKIVAYFTHTSQVSGIGEFAPDAKLIATTPTDINAGESVSFDASASTGTQPLTFIYDFDGDGNYGEPTDDAYTGAPDKPTHIFNNNGTFKVTVKVTNVKGFDISDPVTVKVGFDPNDTYVDADYTGTDSDGTQAKPFKTIQEGMAAVLANHKIHVDYVDGGSTQTYDTNGLTLKSNVYLLGDNWNGGGPGKPRLSNETQTQTISSSYASLSNFTIDGFQMSLGHQSGSPAHYGIYISQASNITIRHCKFTDTLDDTGLTYGVTMPISMSNCNDSLVELNDIGPMTWLSTTPGEFARVLWGMYFDTCGNTEVRNNSIHDFKIDYQGDNSFEQIRMFCIHAYMCPGIDIHNNLICHIEGVNSYSYRMQPFIAEGYSNNPQASFQFHNNTVDTIDNSTADPSFNSMCGFCLYDTSGVQFTNTWLNNELITNLKTTGNATTYSGSYYNSYEITYSTGYNNGTMGNFFNSFNVGPGCVNYPGVDPKYVNNTTSPYDYHFQSGSGCEKGDPDFIDWDDTGTPSGNPDETNLQNRSRMGCFGGPDGNWDPNNL